LNAAQNNVPITAVAAIFQKDPIVLLSHPNVGLDKFQDLTKATAYVATGDGCCRMATGDGCCWMAANLAGSIIQAGIK
jgi:ABC-type nitrate/sulfonate/bicarbonate transport system substrate-binding protein